jgi:hypothetical protein
MYDSKRHHRTASPSSYLIKIYNAEARTVDIIYGTSNLVALTVKTYSMVHGII